MAVYLATSPESLPEFLRFHEGENPLSVADEVSD
jgi:hypothetical protein